MSESTHDQRMAPGLALVAFVDLTVPRATEGGRSAKEGKTMEDKGKGKAEEGQDTYGEGGSSGRGGGRGESTCQHGKQRGKCRECRGEGEAAGGEGRRREEPETQRREKRARTTQPRKKCPHNRQRAQCKDCGGTSICEHNRRRNECKDCGGASICEHNRRRSQCKDCAGASICEHNRVRSRCKDCGGSSIAPTAMSGELARTASDARLSLSPPAFRCDWMLGVHAHAPHDPSSTSARGSCGRHRRSPLRPRSTHTPAMPSDATGSWPCLHLPCVSSHAHHPVHYIAHGHMQRRAYMRALPHVYMHNVAYAHSTSLT
jgi:hypothetical protein